MPVPKIDQQLLKLGELSGFVWDIARQVKPIA
jgi:hypothetical protein